MSFLEDYDIPDFVLSFLPGKIQNCNFDVIKLLAGLASFYRKENIPAGTLFLIPDYFSILITGNFRVNVKIRQNGQQLACTDLSFTVRK